MTVLCPNPCYYEVCYKWTGLNSFYGLISCGMMLQGNLKQPNSEVQ